DLMFDEYARRLVDFSPPGDGAYALQVNLYAKRSDYMTLTNNRFPNTGGVFMPTRNVLAAFLETQGRDGLRRTLQHEAFHQFAYTAISPNIPVWLNEGLAQFFEEGVVIGNSIVTVGQVPPRRIRQLQADMAAKRIIPFDQFLAMTDQQWEASLADKTKASAQYNQSWAMVHFLIGATDSDGEPRYRQRFIEMLKLIHNGTDPQLAWQQQFLTNTKGFQDRFVEWASALQPTEVALYIEHQDVLADMLVELKQRNIVFSSVADFRKRLESSGYRLQYEKGQVSWSSDRDVKVYFCDAQGRAFTTDQLQLEQHGEVLPEIVCRPGNRLQLRTRFHQEDGGIRHEMIVELVK
ncbi:MAG TPA: DUF1570 domain-containing protein, partial [Tepidisphaeraceae bacterium]|nr:DUF1570 domain-containing protein [Tepidisphaeraceae bacterium]